MKLNYISIILCSLFLYTSCQMTGRDIQSGRAQRISERVIKESDILDAVDGAVDSELGSQNSTTKPMQDLTNNYRTFPSSSDVTNYLDNTLSFRPSSCDLTQEEISEYQGHQVRGSVGARRVLATIYQSCAAIDFIMDEATPPLKGVTTQPATLTDGSDFRQRVITNREEMVASHGVLSKLSVDPNFPGDQCIDTTKRPPVYGYGSRKGLRSREINLFTRGQGVAKNNVQASGIDCSEFISAAFAAEGLKFTKSDRDFNSLTTTSLHYASNIADSCVAPVSFNFPRSIKSGDIINFKGSHVLMVDTVGPDPLGIEAAAKTNNCSSITISDFNFTYIHSGALNNYGPARVDAKIHAKRRSTMFNNLLTQARVACNELVKGKPQSQKMQNGRFSILRHNAVDPDCYYEDYGKLKGEECIKKCFDERRLNENI